MKRNWPSGPRRMRPRSRAGYRLALEALEDRWLPSVNVLTAHNDNNRDGLNAAETLLNPGDVSSSSFGKLFSDAVDGQVYAQPLYLSGLAIPGQGTHDVVFVATEHDSVYAFDAEHAGEVLWHDSFINPAAGVTTVPYQDVNCTQITPEIGITGTPVIDPSTGTLYVVAMTKEVSGGQTNYVQRLHALDVTTGAEKFGGPVPVQASVAGNGDGGSTVPFISEDYKERAALLLLNGVVYTTWASHCDITPAHGWVIGYNASTLQQVSVLCTSPDSQLATIWMSDAGPAADANGHVYVVTGNGPISNTSNGFNPGPGDYAETVLNLSPAGGLSVADYFTPSNWQSLDSQDEDFGSGGLLLLPQQPGAYPDELVTAGKEGTIYLIDRDDMGQFHSGGDDVVQELPSAIGGEWGAPAYFNNTVYYGGVGDALKAFTLSNGLFDTSPSSRSSTSFAYPGTTPSVSANGTSGGIVWAIENASSGAILHAYDATNLADELYNSAQAGSRDQLDAAVKFSTPTIANGMVYVGTADTLTVFGLLNLTVSVGGSVLPNGGSLPFANTTVGNPLTQTLTITNNTGQTVTLGPSVNLPAGYSTTGFGATSLASGSSTTLPLTLSASAVGQYPGTASFATNAPAVPNFSIALSGNVYPQPQTVNLPYTDNFNRPDSWYISAAWTQQVGQTGLAGGQAVSQSAAQSLATLNLATPAADVMLQASVNLGGGTQERAAGLVARYSGPGDANFYLGWLYYYNGQTTVQIYRNVGGKFTLLASAAVSATSGALEFDVIGTSLTLSLNGQVVASASDGTITAAGVVGVRSWYTGDTWSNFSASQPTPPQTVNLPYTDNFNRADSPTLGAAWTEQVGGVGVAGDQAVSQSAAQSLATLNLATPAADVMLQASVNLGSGSQERAAGLVARYSGPGDSNFYLGWLYYYNGQTTVQIYRNVGGKFTLLASAPVSATSGALEFDVIGTSLTLKLNGQTVASATDSAITSGLVGVRSWGSGMDWTNFSAASTSQTVTLPYTDNFNRADSPTLGAVWTEQVGGVGISGDQAVSQSAAQSLATLNLATPVADVSVQASVNLGSGSQERAAGLVARYSGPGDSNFYLGWLYYYNGQTTAEIYRNVGGKFTLLASAPVSATSGALEFDVVGTSLTLKLNGQVVASATDSVITAAGLVGIRSWDSGMDWTNFSASAA